MPVVTVLAISTCVAEAEADEGIFEAEAGTVELRTSEGLSFHSSGVVVGILSVAVVETVELRVIEVSSKPSGVAVDAGPP